jgi:hypothetical protein
MKRICLSRLLVSGSVALLVLLSASALLARPGILKTKSGQTYDGDIKDDGDTYTVTVDKIDSQISKTDVSSVSYTGSISDEFNQRMAKLDPKDAEGRVKVARFAFDAGQYDLAIQALSSAVQIDPDNADALDMLKTVQAQRALEDSRATVAAQPAANPPPLADTAPPPDVTQPAQPVPKKLLTPADINSIRQHEILPGEDISVVIPTDLRRKFADRVGMSYADFNAHTPVEQLNMILDKGDAEMKAAAKVNHDPKAIMDFKRLIQPMVLRNCATSGCHGGPAGGKFILYNSNDEATTYTNFYIMEQFAMKTGSGGGFFGGGGDRKMIERGNGAHSLLIMFGLPAGQADVSHPKVPNSTFNGIFRSREDRLAQQAIDWMDHGLNLIEPAYGINYTPPTAPTSQPSTLP